MYQFNKDFRSTPLRYRFFQKVSKSEGCWLWKGTRNMKGYGTIKKDRKTYRAHRVSWELHNGPIPEGKQVLHKCDMRSCVNPDHLYLGTNIENVRDKMVRGRHRTMHTGKL